MVKLIAIGNRLMRDDAAGIFAAEKLKERLEEMGVEIIFGETDAAFVFDLLEKDDFIFILDAVMSGREPGNVYVISLREALTVYKPTVSQHDRSIFDYLLINGSNFEGYFIGIEAAEIEVGEGLSPVLEERISEICCNIDTAITDLLREEKKCTIPF